MSTSHKITHILKPSQVNIKPIAHHIKISNIDEIEIFLVM